MDFAALTPEQLMAQAAEGRFTKDQLAHLLAVDHRHEFLEACSAIERKYTEDCAGSGEPCLEAGCSVGGEICLQPLLHAGSAYHKACAAAWLPIFRDTKNRATA